MKLLEQDLQRNSDALAAVAAGKHNNPFSMLGLHNSGSHRVVRTFQPQAKAVSLVDAKGKHLAAMQASGVDGVFVAEMPSRKRVYRLQITAYDGNTEIIDDCYRFGTTLDEFDLYLLGEGSDKKIYAKLGANPHSVGSASGIRFAVWAPNATRVSVVGDFNEWDGRRHVLRLHPGNGIWETFVPDLGSGARYKFEIIAADGRLLPLKTDPIGLYHEAAPGNASIVYQSNYQWSDAQWMSERQDDNGLALPISIYEVHLGSWRRRAHDNNRCLSYRELADELVAYVVDMQFTHVEFLPVSEHPFDGSWGYQPIGLYAPTQRFGEPDDFRYLVDHFHAAGIGVIVDWVPAHFPRDEHGLGRFDGTALYEHEDPRKGAHADWGTLIFNFGRREVVNYLIGSALYWIEEFHVDALRVDAVASMLYLDYSRKDGEWLPNEHGGNENLEAVAFLKRLNTEVHAHGATTYAEESTAWPGVSRPVHNGGLGFTYKWNMGWMNDTLSYVGEDPVHRKHHHDKMTFGLVYAFTENFILPLSHDEVVHGKGSLLGRMPGDDWQKFAGLRAYLASMYCHPGKKLLFMGSELAQRAEWNHDESLDWHLLQHAPHSGMHSLVKDLNALYRDTPALYEIDFDAEGFEWIDGDDRDNSVLTWMRKDRHGGIAICVCNFTPVARSGFRIGLPSGQPLTEILNTDHHRYGGSNVINENLHVEPTAWNGRQFSTAIALPPLATLVLRPAK